MSSIPIQTSVQAAEADTDVQVCTTAERRLAAEHWLLSTLPEAGRERARVEWQAYGVALLPCGTLFAAVRLPGPLVHAVAASTTPADVDAVLDEALQGGPVICDQYRQRYYVLVPASVSRTWRDAAKDWRRDNVEVLGRESYLGVPRVEATEGHPTAESYWAVPMESAGVLCTPLRVARLIAAGVHQLAEAAKAEAADGAEAGLTPVTGQRP